jgi:hypothetical protein
MANKAVALRLHPNGLVTFTLATFNVTLAVLAALLVLYRRDPEFGETLADLGTGIGLGLFALVWVAALWATRGALHGFPSLLAVPFDVALARGMLWGGRAGVFVFLGVIAVLAGASVVAGSTDFSSVDMRELPLGLLYIGAVAAVGSAVACVVGAAVGAVAALVDFVALLAVHALVRRAL